MEIKSKTFLVTGGASGLGEACVRKLCSIGANVVIMDLQVQRGLALAKECGALVRFIKTDITVDDDVNAAIALAMSDFKGLDGVINCAGVAVAGRIINKDGTPHKLSSFKKAIEVNLIGTFNVIRLATAAMIKTGVAPGVERGVIICTASVAAMEGQIGQAAYSASKGGIVAMTLPVARELARFGIRVLTIAPGIFDTPMFDGLDEKYKATLGASVPFPPRLGFPSEYAQLAVSIIENTMLNGEVIRLDGAIRLAPK